MSVYEGDVMQLEERICKYVILSLLYLSFFFIGLGPNLEKIFDAIGAWRIARAIRSMKTILDPPHVYQEQNKWIKERRRVAWQIQVLRQRDIFLKAMVIEYAVKGKVEEIETLDTLGPKGWQEKLSDSRNRLWLQKRQHSSLFERAPEGAMVREYIKATYRSNKEKERNPSQFQRKKTLVQACVDNGGCCSRGCGCCQRPRDISPSGELYYDHCTPYCLCCTRERGFTGIPKEYNFKLPE